MCDDGRTPRFIDGYIEVSDLGLQGRESEARDQCRALREEARNCGATKWFYLFSMTGKLLLRDNEGALENFQVIEPELGTETVDILLLGARGKVLANLNDPHAWSDAAESLRRAIEIRSAQVREEIEEEAEEEADWVLWFLHHSLGFVLMRLQRYERAQVAYSAAIDVGGSGPNVSVTHSNMGILFFMLTRYEDAERCLEIAKQVDRDDQYGFDDNNLAFLKLFLALERPEFVSNAQRDELLEQAQELLENAILAHPADPTISYNYGLLDRSKNRLEEAALRFHAAWELHLNEASPGNDALAGSLTSLLMEKISLRDIQYIRGEGLAADEGIEAEQLGLSQAARAFFRCVSTDVELFIPSLLQALSFKTERITRSRTIDTDEEEGWLEVLRRWNSYTPFVPGPTGRRGRGGGYFLAWRGKGLVIDPGQDFIDNFLLKGYSLADIDAVVVTHAHLDHIMDLDPLLTLLHERGARLGADARPVDLFLNVGSSVKELSWLANLSSSTVKSVSILYPGRTTRLNEHMVITPIRADHNEIMSERFCIGLRIELKRIEEEEEPLRIGITSDTRWFSELPELYSGCDVLVAHAGSVGFREIAGASRLGISGEEFDRLVGLAAPSGQIPVLSETVAQSLGYSDLAEFRRMFVDLNYNPEEILRSQHLGFSGIYHLARAFSGHVMIISEFGEELGCFRSQIAQAFRDEGPATGQMGIDSPVLTGDIGLRIGLPECYVKCDVCGEFIPATRIRERCIPDQGMLYFCEDHNEEQLRSLLNL